MNELIARRKILVVDDEEDMRELLAATLQDEGYHLLFARDGQQALKTIASEKPELVLLDVVMPGMQGWDVLKAIKSDPETCHIKVAMLTALVRTSVTKMAYEMGADGYLTKPFTITAALEKVRGLMGVKE